MYDVFKKSVNLLQESYLCGPKYYRKKKINLWFVPAELKNKLCVLNKILRWINKNDTIVIAIANQ